MSRKKDRESKSVGLTQESKTSEPLVDSELNELVKEAPLVPLGVSGNEVAITGWIDGVELLIQDTDFKAGNSQSHRILSAVVNMLKSARDHLGDK